MHPAVIQLDHFCAPATKVFQEMEKFATVSILLNWQYFDRKSMIRNLYERRTLNSCHALCNGFGQGAWKLSWKSAGLKLRDLDFYFGFAYFATGLSWEFED